MTLPSDPRDVWELIEWLPFHIAKANDLLRDPELHKVEVITVAMTDTGLRNSLYRLARGKLKKGYGARSQAELLALVVEGALERGDDTEHTAGLLVGALANLGLLPAPDLPELDYDTAVDRIVKRVNRRTKQYGDHRIAAMFFVIDGLKALGSTDTAAQRVFKESYRHRLQV